MFGGGCVDLALIRRSMKKEENKTFNIPPMGTLGLLALGHVGLREWRKVRDAAEKKTKKK